MGDGIAANQEIHLANIGPIEVRRLGRGKPVLFVPSEIGTASDMSFLELLAQRFEVHVPVLPGFDGSRFIEGVETTDDLSYLCLDLIKTLDLNDVTLIGSSLGGWIAAELAVKSTSRLSRLVLIDPYGIKIGDRETRDIADIFAIGEKELAERSFFDQSFARNNYADLTDEALLAIAQNREAAARYGWSPYMHNPKLKKRLHRIDVPALLLWGMQDGITDLDYGRAFAGEIPDAVLTPIERAGHFPQIEQPQAVADAIFQFAEQPASRQRTGASA